jgi:3-mercaptopyruvate sulfurtransferase SseA
VAPRPRPDLNGARVKDPNRAEIWLVDEGRRRWIPDPSTYNNLFRDWNGIRQDLNVYDISTGLDISRGAWLGRRTGTPEVYLVSNNVKRWITSPAVMDKYHFAWQRVREVPREQLDRVQNGPDIN